MASKELSPWDYYKLAFSNYAKFEGRAHRAEFWWFILINFVISFVTGIIFPIGVLYSLAVFIPSLAILSRRLHDVNIAFKTYLIHALGAVAITIVLTYLFNFLGLLGTLVIIGVQLYYLVKVIGKGTEGKNDFGEDPLATKKTEKKEEPKKDKK